MLHFHGCPVQSERDAADFLLHLVDGILLLREYLSEPKISNLAGLTGEANYLDILLFPLSMSSFFA